MRVKYALGLSLSLAKAAFKLRNEGSYLGILWYLLSPLLMFTLLLLIFSDRLGGNIPNYPLYLLLGIITFNFFRKATIESTRIIRWNRGIIKSINFPRESLIGSIILGTLFSHFFEIIVFAIFLIIFKVSLYGLIFYPLILFFLILFIYGVSLILSSLTVYIADLENIWLFVSTLIWLGTPIFYAIEGQTRLFYVSLFNPMYYFITIVRDLIIYTKLPELWMVFVAAGYSLLFFIIGTLIFRKMKIKFVEEI